MIFARVYAKIKYQRGKENEKSGQFSCPPKIILPQKKNVVNRFFHIRCP
jgi:hypothetical protein